VCKILGAILSILVFTGCNHLLYPAERQPFIDKKLLKPSPKDISIPVGQSSLLHAWHFLARSEIKKGLVVHFHGNGQNLTTHFMFMHWIADFGYDYLIFDYRGYGESSDEQATTEKTVEDGVAVFKYVHENFKGAPVIAFGQSLGANVLVRTLQELEKSGRQDLLPSFVVLDSPFLSYQKAASSVLGQRWFLYPLKPLAYLVLSDEWSASRHLAIPKLPALFFHGTEDVVISFDLGQDAFAAWPGPKVFFEQKDGGHTSAFSDVRFIDSRTTFLKCADDVIHKKLSVQDCAR
jgi:alpha-beta hydrolase superfamily lysophospholipase